MANFDNIMERAIAAKGSYEKNLDTEIYRGIRRTSFPSWKGWTAIDAQRFMPDFPGCIDRDEILQGMVQEFYQKRFFTEMFLYRIHNVALACDVSEAATIIGRTLAVKLLQNAINLVIDPNSSDVPTDVDGVASDHLANRVNRADQNDLIACYTILVGAKVIGMGDYFRQWIKK